jgi:hypothetical protein
MVQKSKSRSKGLYRDGRRLVIREGARFPEACAICNKAGDEEAVAFTFARNREHVVEAAVVKGALRAVNDLATGARYTGPVYVDIPLCPWCRGRRLRVFLTGVGLTVAAVAYIVIHKSLGGVILPPGEFGFLEMSLPIVLSLGAIGTGIVLILMTIFDSSNLWFKATKYFDRFVWISGAGKDYLNGLPEYADQHRKLRGRNSDAGTESSHYASVDEAYLSADELIRRANLRD